MYVDTKDQQDGLTKNEENIAQDYWSCVARRTISSALDVFDKRVVWSTGGPAMKWQRLQQLGSTGIIRLHNPEVVAVGAIGVVVEFGGIRTVRRGVDDVVGSRQVVATAVPKANANAFRRFT